MSPPSNELELDPDDLLTVDKFYRGVNLGVKFYRGVNFLGQAKVDGVYVRLTTERARYFEWRRRMGIQTSEDIEVFLSKLSGNARLSLSIIVAPMKKYKFPPINLLWDWQRQLDEILNALKLCNDKLLTIAPPAPGYYISPARNDQISLLSASSQSAELYSLQPHLLAHSASEVASLSPDWRPRNFGPLNADSQSASISQVKAVGGPASLSQMQQPGLTAFHPVIELLYSTCLKVLRSMEGQYSAYKDMIQDIADCLQIWGTGLFQGQVSIDQALNPESKSGAKTLLKKNVAGIIADISILLPDSVPSGHILSLVGEPDNSPSTLQLREIFAIPEISLLPLEGLPFEYDSDEVLDDHEKVESLLAEVANLTECLFCTLSTIEIIIKDTMALQKEASIMDEHELFLIKSEFNKSLTALKMSPGRDLLQLDLQLVGAMQKSLKDSTYAKYMEHKNLKFDAVQLSKILEEEGRQLKYWAMKLEDSKSDQSVTKDTRTAMILNLARIARAFENGFKSTHTSSDSTKRIQAIIDRCSKDYPELEAVLTSPLNGSDAFDPIDILRSSNRELRTLARSKAPELRYSKDFATNEKAKSAALESSGFEEDTHKLMRSSSLPHHDTKVPSKQRDAMGSGLYVL